MNKDVPPPQKSDTGECAIPPPPNSIVLNPSPTVPPSARWSEANHYRQSARNLGEFTKSELCQVFGIGKTALTNRLGNLKPVNPNSSVDQQRWFIGDVSKLVDVRKSDKLSPTDRLALARTKVAGQDERAKKLKNDILEKTLIPAEEVEEFIALAFKVFGRWLDLLPDIFEKKGYIRRTQMNAFLKDLDKAKQQLQADLTDL